MSSTFPNPVYKSIIHYHSGSFPVPTSPGAVAAASALIPSSSLVVRLAAATPTTTGTLAEVEFPRAAGGGVAAQYTSRAAFQPVLPETAEVQCRPPGQ
jgi:hypothetical protein